MVEQRAFRARKLIYEPIASRVLPRLLYHHVPKIYALAL